MPTEHLARIIGLVLATALFASDSVALSQTSNETSDASYMVDFTIWRNETLLAGPAVVIKPHTPGEAVIDRGEKKIGLDVEIMDTFEEYTDKGVLREGIRLQYTISYFDGHNWHETIHTESAFLLDQRVEQLVDITPSNIPDAPKFGNDNIKIHILSTKYKSDENRKDPIKYNKACNKKYLIDAIYKTSAYGSADVSNYFIQIQDRCCAEECLTCCGVIGCWESTACAAHCSP